MKRLFTTLIAIAALACESVGPHNAPLPPAPKLGTEALAAFLADGGTPVAGLGSMDDRELAQLLLEKDRERLEALRGPNPPRLLYGSTLEEEIAYQEALVQEGVETMAWAQSADPPTNTCEGKTEVVGPWTRVRYPRLSLSEGTILWTSEARHGAPIPSVMEVINTLIVFDGNRIVLVSAQ